MVKSDSGNRDKRKNEEALDCLIRYSFEQLDALNGYAAGMPSPYYYDQVWHAVRRDSSADAFAEISRPRSWSIWANSRDGRNWRWRFHQPTKLRRWNNPGAWPCCAAIPGPRGKICSTASGVVS